MSITLNKDEKEIFALLVWKIADRLHNQYCDYPCFTKQDIIKALEGDTPEFLGNVSRDHFWDSYYRALQIIHDEVVKH